MILNQTQWQIVDEPIANLVWLLKSKQTEVMSCTRSDNSNSSKGWLIPLNAGPYPSKQSPAETLTMLKMSVFALRNICPEFMKCFKLCACNHKFCLISSRVVASNPILGGSKKVKKIIPCRETASLSSDPFSNFLCRTLPPGMAFWAD